MDDRLNTSVWDGNEEGWTTVVSKRQSRSLARKRSQRRRQVEQNEEIQQQVPGWTPGN